MGEEEYDTPLPKTVTVRRNPARRARATPYSNIPVALPSSLPSIPHEVPPFPLEDILAIEVPKITAEPDLNQIRATEENLKVFLRIRPLTVQKKEKRQGANVWPRNPKSKGVRKENEKEKSGMCVRVVDNHSVMVSPPLDMQGAKRFKSELYEGFSSVFSADSSQSEVYEKMVGPLVKDLLNGKSGVLVALGPSGSGKTHTVFGCARDPGMVPRLLRQIFSQEESNETHLSRTFHLSMFEISSEKGKSERLYDLLQEGFDVCMQQSSIKGLKEVIVSEVQQAESLIACGMLQRATATTNSNSQSSRSQCIINIRCSPNKVDGETVDDSNTAVLTIVDLAGAEREKKTGNQGLRLLESNFINNTSMVFGQCLRSLLEHQKNPKKPLQKNFQNSLLTRYLKPYLEGKKRMALVLTVKPGEEDYLDTSNLLKQASPFSQIRFNSAQEPEISKRAKRPSQMSQRKENMKRKKLNGPEAGVINERTTDEKQQSISSEKSVDDHLTEMSAKSEAHKLVNVETNQLEAPRREREQQIMVHMCKALWNVLKQYKEKLKVADNELSCLRTTLDNERKIRVDLENEVKDLKCQISHRQEASNEQVEAASNIPCEDVEQLRDSNKSEAGNSNSIGGGTEMCTDRDSLVNQENKESTEYASCITDTRDFKNDVEEEGHVNYGNDEDIERLRISSNSEASDLTSIGGTTAICTDRDGLVNQESEEKDEKASSSTNTRDCKDNVEKGHLNNENAEDVEQLRDSNSSEASDLTSIGGITAICADRDGLVNQESEEKDEKASSSTNTRDCKDDVEKGHLNNENAEDVEQLRDSNSSGTTAICTDRDGLVNQESEGKDEKASISTNTRDCKDDVEKGHLNNENAEDVEQLKDSNSSEASDFTSICGTTAICTDRDGIMNQEREEKDEKASSITDTQDFKDVEKEDHLNNEIAEDVLVLRVEDSLDNALESGETDHSEPSVSSSESCAATTEGSTLLPAEIDKPAQKNSEKAGDLCVKASLNENKSFSKGHEDHRAPEIASKHADCRKSEITEKRKRRLLPASSNLLKDMGTLALEDAYDKPKGGKGEKKSKGSLSLLRMLRNGS